MSSSTVFIALQCCQCSTMQVKQKKKSSNKWSCAVCNQKQSVRKVFAQGFMAKDVRKFVQSFNMARKSIDEGDWPLAGTLDPASEQGGVETVNREKKRSDWTAYLDPEDYHNIEGQEHEQGDDCEPLVVTELPKVMFKRRRFEGSSASESGELFKKLLAPNTQEEPLIDQQRMTSLTESKRNNYVTPENQRTQKCKPTMSKATSKWNDYLSEENDNLELGWKRGFSFKDHSDPSNNGVLEAITSEQRVEDDIHPDFV